MTKRGTEQEVTDEDGYKLRLFVTGASANSMRAINNLNALFETYLTDKVVFEIIDIYQQPELAEQEQIIALPMLIKSSPLPERKILGDMSDTKKVLRALGIPKTISDT